MTQKVFLKSIALIGLLSSTSLMAQTHWAKDPNNPVLRRDTVIANLPNDLIAISDCWVIKEGATYKMWYTCGGVNYPTDTLLRSRLCYGESLDGINWNKYSGNPVLDVSYIGEWDSLGVETPSVIIDSLAPASKRYKMWYAGQTFNSYRYDIGYAFSPDGINWTKHTNPVLNVGVSTTWDNGFLEGPSVIKDGSTYKMWYSGYDAVVDRNGTDGHANVGYATSPDGITWTKYAGNPVLATGTNSWDSIYVQDPHVIKQNGMYYMWYGGNDVGSYGQKVGYAWSSDGINWIKSNANPVLTNGNAGVWDANTASFPSVISDNGIYKMWYTGKDVDPPTPNTLDYYWEIGYAESTFITGITETNNDEELFAIYPNPAQNNLTIQLSFDLKNAEIKIYNQLGQIEKDISNINSRNIKIEMTDLPNGVYFIVVQNGDRQVNGKFIINK